MSSSHTIDVLFVCMGNICRSPTAEGVFRHLVESKGLEDLFHIDSSGTIGYHEGEPPDRRAQQEAQRRGMDISGQRSRPLSTRDYQQFDYIIAMDEDNLADIEARMPNDFSGKIAMLMDFGGAHAGEPVPDPYYGGKRGFEHVFDLVEEGCEGLLRYIAQKEGWSVA